MPLLPYDDPLRVAARKKKEQLKAKQAMTSDVAYTGKKEKKPSEDKRKGKRLKKQSKYLATGGSVQLAKKYFKGGMGQVEITKFIKHVSTKIEKEITDRKDAFAMGKIEDNNYKKVVGELRGLQIARDLIRESSKHIEEEDEQHNL